ncbi:MAG: type IV secretion system DNA-binding domain-containing protein [Leptospirillum sp.]
MFELIVIVVVIFAVLYAIDILKGKNSGQKLGSQEHLRGSKIIVDFSKEERGECEMRLAGVTVPAMILPRGFIIPGSPGAGKTQAIQGWLDGVIERVEQEGSKAIITDSGGGLFSRFGSDDDQILNPFDIRAMNWNPFAEIKNAVVDIPRICESIVTDRSGDEARWAGRARNILIDFMTVAVKKEEYRSPRTAMRIITSADTTELKTVLAGTPSEALTSKDNAEFFASIQGVLTESIRFWQYLDDDGTFSVRDWIKQDNGGILWLTYQDDNIASMRYLVSCWMDIAITEILAGEESDGAIKYWLLTDEIDSLGRIPMLTNALTRGRKYGLSSLAALQSIAQLRDTYGKEKAQVLLSSYVSKLVMQQGSYEDAKYWSDEIGQAEVLREELSESKNEGSSSNKGKETSHGSSSGESNSSAYRRTIETVVLPSELQRLKPLTGYLQLAGDDYTRFVKMDYESRERVLPGFLSK